jgi:putative two-component system response regulator
VSPLTGPSMPLGYVMIVDDNPANLKLLEDMLRQHDYEVRAFPRGRLALAAAEQEPPDLILLDVNMPEMNGHEVCQRLKSNNRLCDVPVIFLSALNSVEDKVKGFRSGGVDYIGKPFQFEEVQARVETQIKLRRAQQAERDLLERTLNGAAATLWELVQLSSPVLAIRSQAIRGIVVSITNQIGLSDPWQYELSARLCLLGCLALPDEVFERAYAGEALSAEEDRMFRAHPERAARLLASIPRLEVVAEIIRAQQKPDGAPSPLEQSRQGAKILHLALELDRKMYRGASCRSALAELRSSRRFDAGLLDALETYSPVEAEFDVRRLPTRELCPGMVLEEDLLSQDGNLLILKQGTTLTETWVERLENFAKSRGAQAHVAVRIPRLSDLPNVANA